MAEKCCIDINAKENCCVCIHQRTGVKIIGVFFIVALLGNAIFNLVYQRKWLNGSLVALIIVPSTIGIAVNVLLLIGTWRNIKWMVISWLILNIFGLIAALVGIVGAALNKPVYLSVITGTKILTRKIPKSIMV